MPATCPQCGSRYLHVSRRQSWAHRLDLLGFARGLRCKDCQHRFVASTFEWREILYARCPKCKRMDLNRWALEHQRPAGWMAFKLALGGKRYRCEYCRVNFVSWRRRKEHFTFNRWKKREGERDVTQLQAKSTADKIGGGTEA